MLFGERDRGDDGDDGDDGGHAVLGQGFHQGLHRPYQREPDEHGFKHACRKMNFVLRLKAINSRKAKSFYVYLLAFKKKSRVYFHKLRELPSAKVYSVCVASCTVDDDARVLSLDDGGNR